MASKEFKLWAKNVAKARCAYCFCWNSVKEQQQATNSSFRMIAKATNDLLKQCRKDSKREACKKSVSQSVAFEICGVSEASSRSREEDGSTTPGLTGRVAQLFFSSPGIHVILGVDLTVTPFTFHFFIFP